MIKPQNLAEVKAYKRSLNEKSQVIVERFYEYFKKHKIEGVNIVKGISELLKIEDILKSSTHRLRSKIYSYDIKENDYYNGVYQVESFLLEGKAPNSRHLTIDLQGIKNGTTEIKT